VARLFSASTRQHPEHHPLDVLDAADDRLAGCPHGLHGEADEEGDQQGLQHLPLGQCRHQGGRHDPDQELRRASALARLVRAELDDVGCQRQAGAGVQDVPDHQADGERDGGHRQEVAERQTADLADVGGAGHRPHP
jgi:hypothetical protein